jgi:hypothetical protein
MSNKHKYRNGPAFVSLSLDLLNSKAFVTLPFAPRAMLPYFCAKVKVPLEDPARYKTSFVFPYGEAGRYGCARRTFFKVVCDLMLRGFIDPVSKGGLRGSCKTISTFRLSQRWKDYGMSNFQESRWQGFVN